MATSLARNLLTRAARRSTLTSFPTHAALPSLQHPLLRWFSSYPPHEVVGMPSLSPTMESGSISSWNVSEGDSFGAGDVLCSVETDKATVDFEAQDDGIVAKIIAEAGPGEIACGTPIMVTVEDEGSVAAFKDFVADVGAAAASAAPAPAPAVEAPAAPAAPTPPPSLAPSPAPSSTGERVVASPRAHTLAKQMGYGDISALRIVGTGPGGRIIAQDVLEYDPSTAVIAASDSVASPASAPAAATSASSTPSSPTASRSSPAPQPIRGPGYVDHVLPPHAIELASRLHSSKRNVPHYYLTIDLSLDNLLALRSDLNSSLKLESGGITVNDLLLKAAAAAMKTVPAANASWMDDSFVRVYDSVDVNVVVGNGSSLYSPVIKDVGRKGLMAVSEEFARVSSVVEEEDAAAEGAEGFGDVGTFTVVNLGMFGIKSCAPIVREPQACALALGAIENRIVPNDGGGEDGEIYKESVMMTATLSCDHRVVDGAVGAQWLAAFKNHVENPVTLLL
eukprot:CAMPEP_0171334006 /NCGR_PEP_ID=MMETSP0878-20121228/4379_1 /TAXON_ID=67004 /ORGANISM="Thalassiosira weissflogii, Strain CCMP1336" /LENGTH=507 /DNA_ID=CAMNT_0011835039 /DNA_START=110 /DNA_END=1633 /DNA_ORIENTATION=+